MADLGGEAVLSRHAQIERVLIRVLLLNLAIAAAKIAFGYASGAISIISDGFHSLTDAGSNVVGLIGVRAARQPPDEDHPYGHRKYETVAAGAVTVFLLLLILEVLRHAYEHLNGTGQLQITFAGFAVMLLTIAVNIAVSRYEMREANRLDSEILLADSLQTRGDIWTSSTVLIALVGARWGLPILDPLAALVVAAFIGYAAFQIARTTTHILSDRIVISQAEIEGVVRAVSGVVGCHRIRTRGSSDHVFLDLHVWLPADMPLAAAHDLSHIVKDRLMARYPQIVDAIIHIEPPPAGVGGIE